MMPLEGAGFQLAGKPEAGRVPTLAQHTDEIPTDLGHQADNIAALRAAGAV